MQLTDLHKEIVMECASDETGLWAILWILNGGGYSANAPLAKGVKEKAIEIIHDLLQGGLIEAGFPELPEHVQTQLQELQQQNPRPMRAIDELLKNNLPSWKPLSYSVSDTIAYIQREWDGLGRDPNIGDIIWFRATAAGERLAQTVKE